MASNKRRQASFLRIVLSLLIGVLCAVLAVIVSNLAFVLWSSFAGIPDPGTPGDYLFNGYRLTVLLIVAVLAGVLSTKNLLENQNQLLIAGAIAGATTAALLLCSMLLVAIKPMAFYDLLFTSLPPYLLADSIYDYAGTAQQNLGVVAGSWPALLGLLIALPILGAAAAYFTYFGFKGDRHAAGDNYLLLSVAALILAVLFLVPAIVSFGIGLGFPDHPTAINYQAVRTIDENSNTTDNASFEFMLMGSPGVRYLDERLPFTVTVDNRTATNQTAADASGLNVKIIPGSGLATAPDSYFAITGLNESHKVKIDANFRDGIRKVIIDS